MSTFFERYQEAMPMNPAVIRLTKLVILMSFVAHLAVRWGTGDMDLKLVYINNMICNLNIRAYVLSP